MGMTVPVKVTCDNSLCKKTHEFDAPYQPPAGTPINQPAGWFKDSSLGPGRACSDACVKELQKVYVTAWSNPVKV